MMRDAAISFPMLGDWSINPSATFELFGHTFYWYGAITALALLAAVMFAAKRAPRFGLKSDDVFDLVLWVLPFAIIGCRIYYVACEWDSYKDNLIDILKIWEGGIAMYGGIIAGVIVVIIWSRAKKIPIGATLDVCGTSLILGQVIGRWANFINREAFGRETEIFCRMGLTRPGAETVYVHPTFLYESLWNLMGFFILLVFINKGKRKYDGQAFIIYAAWYGAARGMIEGLRTDSLYFLGTGIRTSQLVGIVSCVTAIALLIINSRRKHPETYARRVAAAAAAASAPEEAPAGESAADMNAEAPAEEEVSATEEVSGTEEVSAAEEVSDGGGEAQ